MISVYAVCTIEAGEASLLAGSRPVLLASCHRPTTTSRLMTRYHPGNRRACRAGRTGAIPEAPATAVPASAVRTDPGGSVPSADARREVENTCGLSGGSSDGEQVSSRAVAAPGSRRVLQCSAARAGGQVALDCRPWSVYRHATSGSE